MKQNDLNSSPEKWMKAELSVLQDIPTRSPGNAEKSRAKFQSEMAVFQKSAYFSANKRLNNKQGIILPMRRGIRSFSAMLSALFITLVLLLASGGTVVYASQSALPDDVLYPVKLISENLTINLAQNTQERVKLHLEYTNRRLDEMTQLELKGKHFSPSVLERLDDQFNKTINSIGGIEKFDQKLTALADLRKNLEKHEKQIQSMHSQSTSNLTAENDKLLGIIHEQLDLSEAFSKNPQALPQLILDHKGRPEPTAIIIDTEVSTYITVLPDTSEQERNKEKKVTPEVKNTQVIKTPQAASTDKPKNIDNNANNDNSNNNSNKDNNSNNGNNDNNSNNGNNNNNGSNGNKNK